MNISNRFSKSTEIKKIIKIPTVVSELFHSERRTDRQTEKRTDISKIIVAFRNTANAIKIQITPYSM